MFNLAVDEPPDPGFRRHSILHGRCFHREELVDLVLLVRETVANSRVRGQKMTVIYSMLFGCAFFAIVSFLLGLWLRRHPSQKAALISTRIVHIVAAVAVIIPMAAGIAELSQLDGCLGLPPLPFGSIPGVLGMLMMLAGFCFTSVSLVVLLDHGEGLPLLVLSRKLAARSIYRYTRNPMSLGFYLMCIGGGLLGGSTFFTLWSILVLVPAHIVFLKHFEECELEIRLGQCYTEYRKRVPFLIPGFPAGDGDAD